MYFIAETIGRFAVSIPLAIAITMVSFAAFAEIDAAPSASPADGDRTRPALRSDAPRRATSKRERDDTPA